MMPSSGAPLPYLDEEIETYRKLGKVSSDVSTFEIGQIVWAIVPFCEEQSQYWRPTAVDQSKTIASTFNIVGGGGDLFRRQLPLHTPKLTTSEEFLVVRGKLRPVVLLAKCATPDAPKVWARHHHLVVPRFTIVNKDTGQPKLDKAILDRARRLEFPQFLFSPGDPPLERDGLFRVDLVQPIPKTHFRQPTALALSNEALDVMRGQLSHLLCDQVAGPYQIWRGLLNP
jgi:hypothetical protein